MFEKMIQKDISARYNDWFYYVLVTFGFVFYKRNKIVRALVVSYKNLNQTVNLMYASLKRN